MHPTSFIGTRTVLKALRAHRVPPSTQTFPATLRVDGTPAETTHIASMTATLHRSSREEGVHEYEKWSSKDGQTAERHILRYADVPPDILVNVVNSRNSKDIRGPASYPATSPGMVAPLYDPPMVEPGSASRAGGPLPAGLGDPLGIDGGSRTVSAGVRAGRDVGRRVVPQWPRLANPLTTDLSIG